MTSTFDRLRKLWPTLLIAAQALGACTTDPVIPMPSGGPNALPGRVLQSTNQGVTLSSDAEELPLLMVAEYLDLSRAIGAELWPGWSSESIRFAIKAGPGCWHLVNHNDPEPGMDWVLQEIVPFPVFRGPLGIDPAGHGNLPVRGRMTLVLPVDPDESARICEEIVGMLFQLSAHQTMGIACEMKQGVRLSSPPFVPPAPEVGALRRVETQLLVRALCAAPGQTCLDEAARFAAVRKAREEACEPDRYTFEQRLEATEGIALYIRLKALEMACRKAREGRESLLAEKAEGFSNYQKYDEILHSHCVQKLQEIRRRGYRAGSYGFHLTGMAMACLLDRLRQDWKQELMKVPERSMETILFQTVKDLDPVDPEVRLKQAYELCDFKGLLEEERLAVQ